MSPESSAQSLPSSEASSDRSDAALTLGRIEITLDGIGVVRNVNGAVQSFAPVRVNRLITDEVAMWSVALRQFLARTLEAGVAASGSFAHRGATGNGVVLLATATPLEEGTWRLLLEPTPVGVGRTDLQERIVVQERAGLQDLLTDLLSSRADFGGALSESLPWILRAIGMEAGGFFQTADRHRGELIAAYGKTRKRGFPYPDIDLVRPAYRPVIGNRVLELFDDGGDEALRAVACRGARQIILVPASWAGAVNGVLAMSRRVPGELTPEQLQSLMSTAGLLGVYGRISYLSARSQQSSAVLGTAYAVSRAISRSLDLDRTFKQIANNATRLIAGSRCLLLELDSDKQEFVAVASSEPDDELVGLHLRFQDQAALVHGHMELAIDELLYSAQVGPTFRSRLSMQSAVLLPMVAQNELVGSLLLFSSDPPGHVAPTDLALAEDVAEQAAVAIYNARLFKALTESRASIEGLVERIARVREHERREAATILHDDVLQSVIGVLFELESLRGSLDAEVSARMEHPLGVLRSAIDDARVVISDLRLPQLEQLGFGAALRTLAARADNEGPSHVYLTLEGVPDLEPERLGALYRIARQALVNAQRHASARNIWVSVRRETRDDSTWLVLSVADDGIGMDLPVPRDSQHFGLAMMEEQAALAGGTMEFRARLGGGTIVAVRLSVQNQ